MIGFPYHDPRMMDDAVAFVDVERVVGDVDRHVALAELARQPAPAFHIGQDLVLQPFRVSARQARYGAGRQHAGRRKAVLSLIVGHRARHRGVVDEMVLVGVARRDIEAETRADERYARVPHPELECGPKGDRASLGHVGLLAQFGQLRPQQEVAPVGWIEAAESLTRVRRLGDASQDLARIGDLGFCRHEAVDAGRVDPAAAGLPAVVDDRPRSARAPKPPRRPAPRRAGPRWGRAPRSRPSAAA